MRGVVPGGVGGVEPGGRRGGEQRGLGAGKGKGPPTAPAPSIVHHTPHTTHPLALPPTNPRTPRNHHPPCHTPSAHRCQENSPALASA